MESIRLVVSVEKVADSLYCGTATVVSSKPRLEFVAQGTSVAATGDEAAHYALERALALVYTPQVNG